MLKSFGSSSSLSYCNVQLKVYEPLYICYRSELQILLMQHIENRRTDSAMNI